MIGDLNEKQALMLSDSSGPAYPAVLSGAGQPYRLIRSAGGQGADPQDHPKAP